MTARVRFASAAYAFADVVARVPGDCWDRPGLGVWTVRSVVGHTVSVLRNVVNTHLEQRVADLRLQLAEGDEDLAAARATNRELMARINPNTTG